MKPQKKARKENEQQKGKGQDKAQRGLDLVLWQSSLPCLLPSSLIILPFSACSLKGRNVTLYQVLNVESDADIVAVKRAYRQVSIKKDTGRSKHNTIRMQHHNELSTPEARRLLKRTHDLKSHTITPIRTRQTHRHEIRQELHAQRRRVCSYKANTPETRDCVANVAPSKDTHKRTWRRAGRITEIARGRADIIAESITLDKETQAA